MKKRSLSIFLSVLIALSFALTTVFLSGCGPEEEPPAPVEPTVVSISLDTSGAKTEFDFGETFSAAGLKVTAAMSDDTSKDVPLGDCRINAPNTNQSGEQTVTVTHTASRKTASYTVTVASRPIDETALLEIEGENAASAYRVEAEDINMAITEVKASDENAGFVHEFETAGIASGDNALANFGVSGNFFAFVFTSDKAYSNVAVSVAIANKAAGITPIQDKLDVQLNDKTLGLKGGIAAAGSGEYKWREIFAQGLSIKAGRNTVSFSIKGENALLIDYIDFYVGKTPVIPVNKSYVNITKATTYVQEAESDLDLFDFVPQAGFTEPKIENSILASGGQSIGGVGANSTFTVGIDSLEKATVRIIARIAKFEGGLASSYATFMFDNESVDLGEATLSAGYGSGNETRFYNWNDVVVGEFDIDTGKTYDLVFNTPTGAINIDALKFAVLTYGEFASEDEKLLPTPNDYIAGKGSTVIEAEGLDASTWKNTDGASYGEVNAFSSGGKSIGHLAEGSSIMVNVKLSEKATVLVSASMSKYEADYDLAANIEGAFNGEEITFPEVSFGPAPGNDWYNWQKVDCGRYDLEAGIHTLALVVKEGAASPNIDCFEFTAISYGSFTDDAVAGIAITTPPSKTQYTAGDRFDKTGMIVSLMGESGNALCDITNAVSIPAAALDETMTSVTISYGSYTATVSISVQALGGLEITSLPAKTEYNEGDRFDPAGMVISAILPGGGRQDVTSAISYNALVTQNGVTVSYQGNTVDLPLTINNKLDRTVNISANGTFTVEAENINRDGVITRGDFTDLIAGEVRIVENGTATGGKLIEGFKPGTTFTLKIKTEGAAKIAFGVRMAQGGSVSNATSFTFNGNALTASAETDALADAGPGNWYPWGDADLGSVTVSEAGEYEFVCTIKENCALDNFTFVVTDYNA